MEYKKTFYFIISLLIFWFLFNLNTFMNVIKEFHSFAYRDQQLIQSEERPILSYRYKTPYFNKHALCYVNFFNFTSFSNIQNHLESLHFSHISMKGNDNERITGYFEGCTGSNFYPNSEIKLSMIFPPPPFTYVKHDIFPDINELLIYQDTKNIELAKLGKENAEIYFQKSKDRYPIYKGIVIYPSKNLIKVVTFCQSTSDYCNLNGLY